MGEIAERSEWYRRKNPIMEEHTRQRSLVIESIAARNFSAIPGQVIKSLTGLELATKQALSGLNYEIVASAVEREMVQQGVDYDLAYKNAAIAWEIEKAGLIDELTRELADGKAVRESQDQVLAALAIEVGLRQIALINAKTIIELEIEELKQQIIAAQSTPISYEIQLAQEQLVTAQKKLEIIPHLRAIVTAEEEMIAAEEINVAYSENLLGIEKINAGYKDALISIQKDNLDYHEAVITTKGINIGHKQALIDTDVGNIFYKEQLLDTKTANVSYRNDLIASESANIEKQHAVMNIQESNIATGIELITSKEDLLVIKQSLIDQEISNLAIKQELIDTEKSNIDHEYSLIDARLAQIPLKEEAIGLKEYLVTAMDALTGPTLSGANKKVALANARIAYETKARDKISPTNELVTTMSELNTAMQLYINGREELVDPYSNRAIKLNELIAPTSEYAKELTKTIPYIQDLAKKRLELINPSMAKSDAIKTLLTPLIAKAQKKLEYARTLKDQQEIEQAIKDLYLDIENLKRDGVDADVEILLKRLEEGDSQKALVEASVVLKSLEEAHRAFLIDGDATNSVEYTSAKQLDQESVVALEKEASTKQVDTGYEVAQTHMRAKYESVRTTISAKAGNDGSIEQIGRSNASERTQTAKIAAGAEITSKLIHQIS